LGKMTQLLNYTVKYSYIYIHAGMIVYVNERPVKHVKHVY